MGQASSQVLPTITSPAGPESQVTHTGNAPRSKKQKMKILKMKSADYLTNDAEEDEYGQAASSQLVTESEPVQSPGALEEVVNQKKRRRDSHSHKGRKKARFDDEPAPQENETPYTRYPDEDVEIATEPESHHDPPHSTLDEINSDDEEVASFLRDFQEEEMTLYPFDMQHDQIEMPSSPPRSPGNDILLSDTGQHTRAPASSIDFEAFDNYCAAYGTGSANMFDDLPGQPLSPHDPTSMHRSRQDTMSDQVLPGLEDAQQQLEPGDIVDDSARTGRRNMGNTNHSQPAHEEARNQGTFTAAEISKLEAFRDSYCEQHRVSTWQFNELVQAVVREKPKAKAMWQEMYEIIPYRKKISIQRFCRRRFHNFEVRGAWTKEDDEALARAVEEKGKSWVAVGQIMNRSPEDVRDRWRNYHVNAEHRNSEQWTDLEVSNLVNAVRECMEIMKTARKRAKLEKYEGREFPDSEPETDGGADAAQLVNWQVVSDRMGGSRSRLQCSFKWGKLKKQDRDRFMKQMKAVQKDLETSDRENEPVEKVSWRRKKAQKRVLEMRPGDVYDFLQAVSICQAAHEGNIPWKSLGDEDFRRRWTAADRKAAWEMFKDSVLGADGFNYHDIINHLLANLLTNEGHRLDERWDPEADGYGQEPPPKTTIQNVDEKKRKRRIEKLQRQLERRRAKQAKRGPTEWRSKVKSSQVVPASDVDDE